MTVHATLTSPTSGASEQPVSGDLEFTISGLPGGRSIGLFIDIGEGFASIGGSHTSDGDKSQAYSGIDPRTDVQWYAQERDFPSGANPENGTISTFTIVQYVANLGSLNAGLTRPSSVFVNPNPVAFIAGASIGGTVFDGDTIVLIDGKITVDSVTIFILSVSGEVVPGWSFSDTSIVSEGEHEAKLFLSGTRWILGEDAGLTTDIVTRTFDAGPTPPNKVTNPIPTDTDTGIILLPTLSWQAG